jgi:hypothetical protein
LAPFGRIEDVTPEPLMQKMKRLATRNEPPGHFDEGKRRTYLDRIDG